MLLILEGALEPIDLYGDMLIPVVRKAVNLAVSIG